MSEPEIRLSVEQVDAYVHQLREVAAALAGRGLVGYATDLDEIADALRNQASEAIAQAEAAGDREA